MIFVKNGGIYMKGIRVVLAVLMLLLVFAGCQEQPKQSIINTQVQPTQVTAQPTQVTEAKKDVFGLNEAATTVEGLFITFTNCKVGNVKGDRTKDNVGTENGEYFAVGSNVVKVSDYKEIVLNANIKNDTDKAITFNKMGLFVTLPDGYKLENTSWEGKFNSQIASKSDGIGTIKIITEKNTKTDEILLTYKYINFNDEWNDTFSQYLKQTITEKQYLEKYTPIPIKFKIKT
jgi:hypothetical protein